MIGGNICQSEDNFLPYLQVSLLGSPVRILKTIGLSSNFVDEYHHSPMQQPTKDPRNHRDQPRVVEESTEEGDRSRKRRRVEHLVCSVAPYIMLSLKAMVV